MKKIRELRADEIEVRVGVVRKNGISLLLYKDARCDMNILDVVFFTFLSVSINSLNLSR